MTRIGADATSTSVTALRNLGATWVSRYLSDFPEKNLTAAEAKTLSTAGFDLVSNWENNTDDWLTGRGVAYAQRAAAQHAACGGPDWAPIFFSVDENVDPTDPRLHQYFRDINGVLGVARTGAYAQTSVLRALRAAGLIRFTWRSMSTFGLPEGLGNPGEFDIEQTGAFNDYYDRDVANSAYFGQWRIGAPPPQGAVDMEQTDKVNGTLSRGNTVGDVLADATSLRDQWYLAPGVDSKNPPPAGSRFNLLFGQLADIQAKVTAIAGGLDPKALAASLAAALQPAIAEAIQAGIAPEADQLAVVIEQHLAAALAAAK